MHACNMMARAIQKYLELNSFALPTLALPSPAFGSDCVISISSPAMFSIGNSRSSVSTQRRRKSSRKKKNVSKSVPKKPMFHATFGPTTLQSIDHVDIWATRVM